jgi:cell filamentation protein
MRDPYLFDDVDILRNLGNIRDINELKRAEGDVTRYTMAIVYTHEFTKFDVVSLCEIHRIIFDRLYDWAGEFRTIPVIKREEILGGDSVRYSHPKNIKKELKEAIDEIKKLKTSDSKQDLIFKLVRILARMWQIHPFRDGNTRTIISFIVLLAERHNIDFNYSLFEEHAAYVRNALVWASQGMYSRYEYIERIFFDAAGVKHDIYNPISDTIKDYTHIEGYYIVDYIEQPHIYVEDE